jgi:hypothetical protein
MERKEQINLAIDQLLEMGLPIVSVKQGVVTIAFNQMLVFAQKQHTRQTVEPSGMYVDHRRMSRSAWLAIVGSRYLTGYVTKRNLYAALSF